MPVVVRILSEGVELTLPAGKVLGRDDFPQLDPEAARRISSAHAQITPRAEGLLLRPLRGEVRVDGRSVAESPIAAGQVWWLAPGLELLVLSVAPDVPGWEPTTAPLTWTRQPGLVLISAASQQSLEIRGTQAGILHSLLEAPTLGQAWEPIAARVLEHYQNIPPQRRDPKAFRNLFDYHCGQLRRALEPFMACVDPLREPPMLWISGSLLHLRWVPLRDRLQG